MIIKGAAMSLDEIFFYVIIMLGAIIIIFNLFITVFLRTKIPGGYAGKWFVIMWLCMFIFIFSEGAGAFFFMTRQQGIYLSYIFISLGVLAAAIFMAVANRFIYKLIKELEKIL
jgi:hypothetical protein